MQVRVVMAMTKNEQYWSDRFERLKRREMAKADTLTAGTARMYQETLEKLRKDVIDWYVRYADENGLSLADAQKQLDAREMKAFKLKIEHYVTLAKKKGLPEWYQKMLEQASIRARLDRSQQIYIQTAHHIEMLANRQNLDLTELLANVYGDSYYRTAYETQQMKGFSPFLQIGQEQIDAAISKPWAPDGKDFSSRIWENKDQLIQNLHIDLTHALMTGGGTTAIAEGIAKRMNTSFFNARRLIETETAYVQEKAAFDCYKELDVEQYQILAVLDRKTSRICRKLDGKVFAVKDAKPGVTMPPFHCHCRTTTVPYLEELEGVDIEPTRTARDPDTGKTVFVEGDLTYEKWYNQYVREPLTRAEEGAVLRYIGSDAYRLNEKIRNRLPLTADETEWTATLDRALNKVKTYRGDLSRSLTFYGDDAVQEFLARHPVGQTVKYSAYTSMTAKEKLYNPSGQVQLFVLNAKHGRDIRDINTGEQEVLYLRDSRFRVKSVKSVGRQYHIYLEEIADE